MAKIMKTAAAAVQLICAQKRHEPVRLGKMYLVSLDNCASLPNVPWLMTTLHENLAVSYQLEKSRIGSLCACQIQTSPRRCGFRAPDGT